MLAGSSGRTALIDASNSAAYRARYEDLLGDLLDDVHHNFAIVGAGGDVEEDQLVCALLIIEACQLSRVARVANVDEAHPFYDSASIDVQAGYYALRKHGKSRTLLSHDDHVVLVVHIMPGCQPKTDLLCRLDQLGLVQPVSHRGSVLRAFPVPLQDREPAAFAQTSVSIT